MLFVASIENLKNLKYHTSLKKFLLLLEVSVEMKKKIFKPDESIEILKTLGLIENI